MQVLKKFREITSQEISQLLREHYTSLMATFYETQSTFLTGIYKRYNSIEAANIILCFTRNVHLEIIRQREKNLNFNFSLENFWDNFNEVPKQAEKITSVVQLTGIPKETVRRKIKNLLHLGFLLRGKNGKGYLWNLAPKKKDAYYDIVNNEIKILSKFISRLAGHLNLNLNIKPIEQEIKSQFSFYWFHFLSCQLEWLKMWQTKLKDNDLLLIILQAVIPTLQYADKKILANVGLDNIFKIVGKTNIKYDFSDISISATSVSEVTGIPRATCIRKLKKLVVLGFLIRLTKSKRYFVNQSIEGRTKNIFTKDSINFTIETYSQYLATILNSLIQNQK